MNILILGNDGRAHALAWKLSVSRRIDTLYCIPGNGGTQALCKNLFADSDADILRIAAEKNVSLIVSAAGFSTPTDGKLPSLPENDPADANLSVCFFSDGKICRFMPPVYRTKDGSSVYTGEYDAGLAEKASEALQGREYQSGIYRVLFHTSPEGIEAVGIAAGFGRFDAQVLMPVLSGDLLPICFACLDGTLERVKTEYSGICAAAILNAPSEGVTVRGMGKLPRDVGAFYEHTVRTENGMTALGGTALDVMARAETTEKALDYAKHSASCIVFGK